MAARGIYLIGFSGTGKSTIARLVGARLGWPVFDLDQLIAERAGIGIPEIFAREGEPGFRLRETEALREVARAGQFVVATGGGAPVRAENRRLMAATGWLIALEGRPETLHARIERQLAQAAPDAVRPLLSAGDPLAQMRALKHSRQPVYALADWTVHTDRLSADQVAAEVARAAELLGLAAPAEPLAEPPAAAGQASLPPPPLTVAAGAWPYQVVFGWQSQAELPGRLRRLLPRARQVALLADSPAHAAELGERFTETGLAVHTRTLAADQPIKTLASAGALYDWLHSIGQQRDDALLALGGGALTDLAAFVAGSYLRGLPLVLAPSSLAGMLGGAIGGSAALDHAGTPDLLGSFYHPRLVWADAAFVGGEPPEQRRAGWAMLVQYAMLEHALLPGQQVAAPLFELLEQQAPALVALEPAALLGAIARGAAIKAQLVAADERAQGQQRALLAYGQTIGAALLALAGAALTPGDAHALGMLAELRLAVRRGAAPRTFEPRLRELLASLGLATRLPEQLAPEQITAQIADAQQRTGEPPRWVLPSAAGRASLVAGISTAELADALASLQADL